jgi:hypothetical protein
MAAAQRKNGLLRRCAPRNDGLMLRRSRQRDRDKAKCLQARLPLWRQQVHGEIGSIGGSLAGNRQAVFGPTDKAGGHSIDLYFGDALTISRAPEQ